MILGTVLLGLASLTFFVMFLFFCFEDDPVMGWIFFVLSAVLGCIIGIMWTAGTEKPDEPTVHYQRPQYCVTVDASGNRMCFYNYQELNPFLDKMYGKR